MFPLPYEAESLTSEIPGSPNPATNFCRPEPLHFTFLTSLASVTVQTYRMVRRIYVGLVHPPVLLEGQKWGMKFSFSIRMSVRNSYGHCMEHHTVTV